MRRGAQGSCGRQWVRGKGTGELRLRSCICSSHPHWFIPSFSLGDPWELPSVRPRGPCWAGSTPGSSCPSRQSRQLLLVVIPVSTGRKPAGERLSPLAKALWALLWRGWRAAGLRQPAHKVSIVPVLRVGMPLLGMLAGSLRCAVISAGPARNRYSLIIQGLRWEPFK